LSGLLGETHPAKSVAERLHGRLDRSGLDEVAPFHRSTEGPILAFSRLLVGWSRLEGLEAAYQLRDQRQARLDDPMLLGLLARATPG
jgi:hypothetical protein